MLNELAVTFFVADSLAECVNNYEIVQFDEDIHSIIWNDKANLPEIAKILYSLDPFDVKCFMASEVEDLKIVCSELQLVYRDNEQMINFFISLMKLCNIACQQKKHIIAVGD